MWSRSQLPIPRERPCLHRDTPRFDVARSGAGVKFSGRAVVIRQDDVDTDVLFPGEDVAEWMVSRDAHYDVWQPVGPVDGRVVPRYAGLTTFARLPRIEDVAGCDVAVVGIPFDTGVSYRPGARFGPAHIRQCSRVLRP